MLKRFAVGALVSLMALVLAAMFYSVVGTGGAFMGIGTRKDYTVTVISPFTGKTLTVNNSLGGTTIKGNGKPGEIRIEATVSLWGWGSQAKAERQVAVEQDLAGTRIVGRGGGWVAGPVGFGSMTRLVLTVPENVKLAVSSSLGRISLEDGSGEADLQTGSAVVEVNGFRGKSLTAGSQMGTVAVKDATLSTQLALQSGLGSVSFSGIPGKVTSIVTRLGAVNLRLPEERAYRLNVSQGGPGRVSSELAYKDGVVGSGAPDGVISVRTILGAVSIHRR